MSILRPRYLLTVAAAATLVAACGSSKSTTAPTTTAPATGASGSVTIAASTLTGPGSLLVDGSGHALYLLTSEKDGHVTCTSANGCTTYWPPLVLPSGASKATAGPGVRSHLLGVVMDPNGSHQVTYAGYPLYTCSGDSGAGTDMGQGVKSFGGTWWVVSPSGSAVTAGSTSSTTSPSSGGGSGY